MGKKKVLHYDSAVGDKARTPFAMRLQDLTKDPKTVSALKEYLGCTYQAINQYRLGTSFPKMENLLKMADFFNVRLEYLLGRSEIPSRNESVEAICEYTGLSVETVNTLKRLNDSADERDKNPINAINSLTNSLIGLDILQMINCYLANVPISILTDGNECDEVEVLINGVPTLNLAKESLRQTFLPDIQYKLMLMRQGYTTLEG